MLTDKEKDLMREAILAGVFSEVGQSVISAQDVVDIQKKVAAMSDEDIRAKLVTYTSKKKQALQDSIKSIMSAIAVNQQLLSDKQKQLAGM